MKDRNILSVWIHHCMAMVGGYLGVYALLCRSDFFGNAQTANLIYIVTALFGHNFKEAALRVIAVLLYMSGIALTVLVSKKLHRNLHVLALVIDAVAIFILGFFPADMDPVLGLYPIFFAMAVQWNSFPSANGYSSSCIFSTNNTRQLANALTEYAITRDKAQFEKARFFGATLFFFHVGVALCIPLHRIFAVRSVWFCGALLIIPAMLVAIECRQMHFQKNTTLSTT